MSSYATCTQRWGFLSADIQKLHWKLAWNTLNNTGNLLFMQLLSTVLKKTKFWLVQMIMTSFLKYLLDSQVNRTWPNYKLIQLLESSSVSNLNSSFNQIGPLHPSTLTVLWFFISSNKWCYLLVPERVVIQRGQAVVDGSCAVLTHRLFGRLDIHITVF